MPEEAQIIFPTEDLNIAKVLNMGCWSKQESYSVNGEAQNNYTAISSDYSKIRFKTDTDEGELNWKMFGEYNARNAMSAILAARRYGVTLTQSLEALSNFKGVAKRQDILIEEENIIVMEDFAHHPTAIQMTLSGLRNRYKDHKIIAAIELRSNTMKSGHHDDVLIKATKEADKVYWKIEDKKQLDKFLDSDISRSKPIQSVEETSNEIVQGIEKKTLIVVISNADFDGLSQKIINKL
tara:strand:- start:423 stop:1136 length:714 start_codon:yes stop_codon:yes gene_type:complete